MIAIALLLSWVSLIQIKEHSKQQLDASLRSTLQSTNGALNIWINERTRDALLWATNNELKQSVAKLIAAQRSKESLINHPAQKEIRNFLSDTVLSHYYQGMFIISPDYISLASMRDSNVGTKNLLSKQQGFLEGVFSGKVKLSHPQYSDVPLPDQAGRLKENASTMFVAAPITDTTGKVTAALAFRIDPTKDFSRIADLGQITGGNQTYFFNRDGKLITYNPSNKYLQHTPHIVLSSIADHETGESLERYNGFRGTPVVGAWFWNSGIDMGIAIEIDAIEAYKPYHDIKQLLMIVVFMIVILFAGIYAWIIREHKRTEQVSRKSEAQFSGILELAHDAIISVNQDLEIIIFNASAEKIFGYSQSEIIGKHINLLIPESVRDKHDAIVFQFLNNDTAKKDKGRITALKKSGEEFPAEGSISTYGSGEQKVITMMLHDISDTLKKDEQLQKLSQAVEQGGEAIFITDENAIIEYVNPAFIQITGYSSEEVLGKSASILKSGAQDPSFYKKLWATVTQGDIWQGTLIDKKKDGTLFPALVSISPIQNANGETTHYVSVQQDMTKHQLLEEQLLQSQKMEAVGTLVGGIAHDFNNMLAGVMGNVFLIKKRLKNETYAVEKLANIELLSKRAADMIKQMLVFAREDVVSMQVFQVAPFFKEALKLARSGIPENITITRYISTDDILIKGDGTQLQQLVMNLLNNAKDALSGVEKPNIVFELVSFYADDLFLEKYAGFETRKLLRITVSDNGHGIPKELLARIFEPFFTTKGIGKGTGLGLSMVFGAVQRHNGVIEVTSNEHEGTTFKIYLPQEKSEADIVREDKDQEVLSSSGELILLVDDEKSILSSTGEVLGYLGYKVLMATNGEEALEVFKSNADDIRLVFTDVVMPRLGGLELAKKIREYDASMPILFATGYDRDHDFSEDIHMDQSDIITKPFEIKKLSQLIHSLLSPE